MDANVPAEPSADDLQKRRDKIADFRDALFGGIGLTASESGVGLNGNRFKETLDRGDFRQSGLEDVALSFWENVNRLLEYARLPQSLFDFGRLYQQAYALICGHFNRNPNTSTGQIIGEITPAAHQTIRAINEALDRWALGLENLPVSVGVIGTGEAASFAGMDLEYRRRQLDGYFSSLVIQGWIVFETLSEDLWEAALNAHPTTLADLGGKTTISLNDLQRNHFDVRSKMGTILKDRKNDVSFRTLKDIQEAYSLAFSKQGSGIADILKRPYLRYAAAVRNLLVHKRGIVDKEFENQTSGITDVPAVAVGDCFPLGGHLSGKLVDACRHTGIALILAVHGWIDGHPEEMAAKETN